VMKCEEAVLDLEAMLDIISRDRWVRDSEQFAQAKKLVVERKYRLALDRLERLVVQRLFELQKCHVAETGELHRIALVIIY
jgi:hypothetical protein